MFLCPPTEIPLFLSRVCVSNTQSTARTKTFKNLFFRKVTLNKSTYFLPSFRFTPPPQKKKHLYRESWRKPCDLLSQPKSTDPLGRILLTIKRAQTSFLNNACMYCTHTHTHTVHSQSSQRSSCPNLPHSQRRKKVFSIRHLAG